MLANLVASKAGTNLAMLNGKGTPSVVLANINDAPGLVLSDENSKSSVNMMVFKEGPKLALFGVNGNLVWSAIK